MACGENAVSYRRVLAVLLLLLSGTVLAAARDLALVSNKANNVNAVTPADLVKLTERILAPKTAAVAVLGPKASLKAAPKNDSPTGRPR